MAGLRVIDLTRVLGGPYCTQILADHGADVIKVEPPAGDEVRDWGPPFHGEDAAYFVGINRNKRGIGLDLASEGGRAVLMKLLESADVLIENFKPGTLEKWGIGSDVLRAKFPKMVHCRISGFGADGPRGGNPGYDAIIQAMTGMIAATGSPQSGPMRIGVPLVDITTGLYAAIGILMALSERQRSGVGQFLETTLYETGLAIMHPHAANYFMHGKPPQLTGNEHPNLVPYAIFPTRTDNIFIGVGNDGTFRN
jgi:formyl-CoA transferase